MRIPVKHGLEIMVDDDLYPILSQKKWAALKIGNIYYAIGWDRTPDGKQHHFYMHRFIAAPLPGLQVNHINGNGLDNRRDNLQTVPIGHQAVRPKRNVGDRFWSHVDQSGECWLWTGRVNAAGYGQINVSHRMTGSHRLAYQLAVGPIPDGYCVCHTCDNPRCVRPDHLFVGTQADNMRDKVAKGRQAHARDGVAPRSPATGERHGRHKLTWDQVNEMRKLHSSGHAIRSLSERYRISSSLVRKIIAGLNWK